MNRIEEAILFAVRAHEGQTRKLNQLPYILHPMEVATIISTLTTDEDVIAAGLLHDTVEDTDVTIADLATAFGLDVAYLVASETEKTPEGLSREASWKARKEGSLQLLRDTEDIRIKQLWLGDKLSNMRSFYREYKAEGMAFLEHLHQKDPAMQEWYYRTVLSCLTELKDTAAYEELLYCVDSIFGKEEL